MSYPDRVLDEIFFLIDKSDSKKLSNEQAASLAASEKTSEDLALSLFPDYRDWLEEDHIYERTPEMYISVYFNQTNDLVHQYQMIRYMELRPSKATNDLVKVWYRELRKKRSRSFDDKPLLPGIPDYPAFAM